MKSRVNQSFNKTLNSIKQSMPIIIGVVVFISIFQALIPGSYYSRIFRGDCLDTIIGSIGGSVATGNPITSYIIGEELIKNNVSFQAVTAFIVSWVTVGVIQFPAEALMLGKQFALVRNILAFISSIIIALITSYILNLYYV